MTRGRLWAVTAYFNPCGYQNRRDNYDVFRRALNVPLVTVELAGPRGFDLRPDQADVLVRLSHGDLMWQKERLLNAALAHLPPSCEFVAWLDCDVLLAEPDWADEAIRRLRSDRLVQLFGRLTHLMPGERARLSPTTPDAERQSFAAAWTRGLLPRGFFRQARTSADYRTNCGMAWAASRALLDECGLYDAMILGMGDKFVAAAAVGLADDAAASVEISAEHAAHYRAWARRFHAAVDGRVGATGTTVHHLWHGSLSNRRYVDRYVGFSRFAFDPARDLRAEPGGAWRWARANRDLSRHVEGYFASRLEDGADDEDVLPAAAAG